MSKIECQYEVCGRTFQRVVLRGEKRFAIAGPECRSRQIKVAASAPSLFNGISNFSALVTDTNGA